MYKEINESFMDWSAYDFSEDHNDKFLEEISLLSRHHYHNCYDYRKLIDSFGYDIDSICSLNDIFPLPVRLFKKNKLVSVPDGDIVKTMTSSGTTGQERSRIFLDKRTAGLQIKVLSKIMADFIGGKRLPMLVIEPKSTVSNRYQFSARTAGVLGFSMFGRDVTYALNEDMTINYDAVNGFIKKHKDNAVFVFGFTYIVWLNFIRSLENDKNEIDLSNAILIHGGGWKKITSESVDRNEFKYRVKSATGIEKIHNYYGMVEQTGSIFMECEKGYLHSSAWSEIIVRDEINFRIVENGKSGLVQLLSLIPSSYPGHSILSEDIGTIIGVDSCDCGRSGTYFLIDGRLKQAEVRGCSDTYTK